MRAFSAISFTLSALSLSSKRSPGGKDFFASRQTVVVGSLLIITLLGEYFGVGVYVGTVVTGSVAWLLLRELELESTGLGIKLLATYMIFQYLYVHPDNLIAMFDPRGLYI